MQPESNIDPSPALDYWRRGLSTYQGAYETIQAAFTPSEHLFSKDYALKYVNQRTDSSYPRDMTLLTTHLVGRDQAFNCLPLMLYILEKGHATFPSCLDKEGRTALHSSACISINHAGGPHIAYVFKRSNQELNSLIFGGVYGMILATCSTTPMGSKVRWFGDEKQGPRSLPSQIEAVEKLASHLLANIGNMITHVSSRQYSSLAPLCLAGHYNSLGHYIWNELPLLGLIDCLPRALNIAIGEHDFANIHDSDNKSPKSILSRVEMNGVHGSLSADHVYTSSRPLLILKDIFALGKPNIKDSINSHLAKLANPDGILSKHIQIAEQTFVVAIGLRITGRRSFASTSELIQILDTISTRMNINISFYLDGFSQPPERPYKSTNVESSEQAAVNDLLASLPESVRDKCLPYVTPTLADKRLLLNKCFCGFFPIGSSAIFQGWLTDIPAFYYDDGRYFNQFIEQDYICNSIKKNCFFMRPSLFAPDTNEDGFRIDNHEAVAEYLETHVLALLQESSKK